MRSVSYNILVETVEDFFTIDASCVTTNELFGAYIVLNSLISNNVIDSFYFEKVN